MSATKYTCTSCGQEHEEWPALAFASPTIYNYLSDDEKKTNAELTTDICMINYGDQVDRFIRCKLTQKVTGHCENLSYGLWVSISEKSFQDYTENFDNPKHEAKYFGWLSSDLPEYEFPESIPVIVLIEKGNERPEIFPPKDFDNLFVTDYYNGITKAEAERRIKQMMDSVEDKISD